MPTGERTGVTLWIGGTSSLTRTFVNQYGPQGLTLLGLEAQPPAWIHTHTPFLEYVSCDLTTLHDDQVRALLSRHSEITSIVIGVRPLLFAPYANNMEGPRRMIQGIERLLQEACQHLPKLQFVLHISSVAAMDHLRTQQFVTEEAPFPPWQEYKASYDIFKRQCEETITQICSRNNIFYCHLRLSAIFSDDAACIQCRALNLQRRMGCYLPLAIDCNSSANVSRALHGLLCRSEQQIPKMQHVYYYTRPLLLEEPVPYGYYLQQFRVAYGLERTSLWIPVWVVTCFVAVVHWFAQCCHKNVYLQQLPYVDAVDYLLQVASREHSFDCSSFGRDFPGLQEETILDCFQRRKALLESNRYRSTTNTRATKKKL